MKLRALLLLLVCAACLLSACTVAPVPTDEETPSTEAPETDAPVPEHALLLFDGEAFRLSVIVSEEASQTVRSAALSVVNALEALGNGKATVTFREDFMRDEAAIREAKDEVLVGATNRPAGIAAQRNAVLKLTHSVSVDDDRAVLAGCDDGEVQNAATYFCQTYLPAHLFRSGKAVYLLPGAYEGPSADLSFIAHAVAYDRIGEQLTYKTEQVLDVPGVADTIYNIQQGACIDDKGKYGYFVMRDPDDNCALVKYDLETGKLVASKTNIGCAHGNDACYNPQNNTVVVSHCTIEPRFLSVFNADTLELIRRVDTGLNNSAVDYCPSRGLYVIMGGGYFYYLDADFKLVEQHPTRLTPYTSQGIHCDDRYIYRVESSSSEIKGNVIEVYDWEGNYLLFLPLPDISIETETLAHLGTDLYVICYVGKKKGGRIYKMSLDLKEND